MLRLALDSQGLAPHIANLGVWRAHLLERVQRQAEASGDPRLWELHESLRALAMPEGLGTSRTTPRHRPRRRRTMHPDETVSSASMTWTQ
jgi:hypothetical protein